MASLGVSPAGLILGATAAARRTERGVTDQAYVPRRPGDTVDIRTGVPSASPKPTIDDPVAPSDVPINYSGFPTVTFSVNYPGGTTVTTTMSLTDFQAALQSNDPSSLGDCECDGQTSYARDAIEVALGIKAGDAHQTSASPLKGGNASSDRPAPGSPTPAPAAVTGEDVAVAILRDGKRAEGTGDQSEDRARGIGKTASAVAHAGSAALAAATFSGSSNGLTVTLSIVAGSVASPSTAAPSAGTSASAVDVLA